MARAWRYAKCKRPRRSSPSTKDVADTGETGMAQGHVGHEAQDPHRLRAMPYRDPRRATDEDTRDSGGVVQRIGSLESRMTRKCPVRFGGGRREKDASGCPSLPSHHGLTNPGPRRASPAAYPTGKRQRKPFVGTLRVTSPARQSLASGRKRVLRGAGATRAAKRRQRVSGPCH
jgi:hypothetical protein